MRLAEVKTTRTWIASPIGEFLFPIISKILLINATELASDHLNGLYVTKRINTNSKGSIENQCKRLKQIGIDTKEFLLGSSEMDLLDFPHRTFRYSSLCLIGPVGCGKSSLIRYTYNFVMPRIKGAERTIPIIIDCSTLDQVRPCQDFLSKLMIAWNENNICNKIKMLSEFTHNLISETFEKGAKNEKVALDDIVNIFASLKRFKDNKNIPILVFDNSDSVYGLAVETIRTLAKMAAVDYQICTILPVRPDTYNTYSMSSLGSHAFVGFKSFISRPCFNSVINLRLGWIRDDILTNLENHVTSNIRLDNKVIANKENIIGYLQSLANLLVDDEIQYYLWKMCNESLRIALAASTKLANYCDALLETITEKNIYLKGSANEVTPINTLIKSIMLDEVPLYGVQDTNSVCLPNLFRVENSHEISVAHKYWILCYMEMLGVPISETSFVAAGTKIGLSYESNYALFKNCLSQGLLIHSEHNIGEPSRINVVISPRGKLFLESLIDNVEYIYQVSTDIHVSKDILNRAKESDPDAFLIRVLAFKALLSAALVAEERLIAQAKNNNFELVLRKVMENKLLSDRLIQPFQIISNQAQQSKVGAISAAGIELYEFLGLNKIRVKKLKGLLNKAITSSGNGPPSIKRKEEMDGGVIEINLQYLGGKKPSLDCMISIIGDIADSETQFICLFDLDGKGIELNSPGTPFLKRETELSVERYCSQHFMATGEKININYLGIKIFANGAPFYHGQIRNIKNSLQFSQSHIYPLTNIVKTKPPLSCVIVSTYKESLKQIQYTLIDSNNIDIPLEVIDTKDNVERDVLCKLCRKCVKSISHIGMMMDTFKNRFLHIDSVRSDGYQLARYVMTDRVMLKLKDVLASYDFVGFATDISCLPWEACHLGNFSAEGKFPLEIGNFCRFPLEKREADISYRESSSTKLSGSVLLIGHDRWKGSLGQNNNTSSLPSPQNLRSVKDYFYYTQNKQRVYLVGHREPKGIKISDDIFLDYNDIITYQLPQDAFGMFGTCHGATRNKCHEAGKKETPNDNRLPFGFAAAINSNARLLVPLGKIQDIDAADIINILENDIFKSPDNIGLWTLWNNCRKKFNTPMWPFFALCGSWGLIMIKGDENDS